MIRFILPIIGGGILAGLGVALLEYLGFVSRAAVPLAVGLTVIPLTLLTNKFWPLKPTIAPPDPGRLHLHYLALAAVGAGLFSALVLLQTRQSAFGWGLMLVSVALGLWLSARQNALRILHKTDPALFDERAQANQRRSEKWAFIATLEIALILGWLDFQDITPLSGAFVGFGAAFAGVMTGLLMQAWFEWRDTR